LRLRALGVIIVAALAGASASPVSALPVPSPSIDLSPAIAAGVAQPNTLVGPFGIRNLTGQSYTLRVIPVLLGQQIDGSIVVKTDAASLATAKALITPSLKGAQFPAGASFTVSGQIPRIPSQHSLYGGLLFQSTPVNKKTQIVTMLSLDGRVLLDPPAQLRRVTFTAQSVRAQETGPRQLTAFVPVTNRGNYFVDATGAVDVRDSTGTLVFSGRLSRIKVLPGATVELTAPIATRLTPGRYSLSAQLEAGGTRFGASGQIRLFGINEVATENAHIESFPTPTAYRGQKADISVTYANTGNVPFAPRVEFELRAMTANGVGSLITTIPVKADRVDPGQRGTARGSYAVPDSGRPFLITAKVFAGTRPLDARDVSVTPIREPSVWVRVKNFITDHALLLVVGLAGLLIAGVAGVRLYVLRLKRGIGPKPPTMP
jgi:hypothetical protein